MTRSPRLVTSVLTLCCSFAAQAGCAGQRSGPTKDLVVFVVVDTLRRDHLGIFGYDRETSPFIDHLAKDSLFLANMVSHASQTVPSVASIITSTLPSVHGIQFYSGRMNFGPSAPLAPVLRRELTTMAEYFSEAGFHTIGLVANPWLRSEFGFAQGFDDYFLHPCFRMATDRATRCDGRDLTSRAIQYIRHAQNGRKVFLYLHYMDVHHPYGPANNVPRFFRPAQGNYAYRDGLVRGLTNADLEFTEALYDEKIGYLDELLSDLMDVLGEVALKHRSILIVTSDHGDEFYEHGGLGHGTTLYNELINSFAILWGPGVFPAQKITRYIPAMDLLPTLLEALQIEPDAGVQGHSLWPLIYERGEAVKDRPIVSELGDRKAVIFDRWKLILDLDSGQETFYDIGSDGQIETMPTTLPDERKKEEMLRTLLSVLGTDSDEGVEFESIDPATLRRLRSLGYLR